MKNTPESHTKIYPQADDDFAYGKSTANYARPRGTNLLERTAEFGHWRDARIQANVWPYERTLRVAPGTNTTVADKHGRQLSGLNFASQDYLSLTSHPAVTNAAIEAISTYGPHSAGSPILLGNTPLSDELSDALCDLLKMSHVTLYPTGWAAGFGVVTALVRRYDHIVIDQLAHACLHSGAMAATNNVTRIAHLSVDELEARLKNIRATDGRNGILVITEGLFSMDSDSPDIPAMQQLCRRYDATLLVDVAHDLGALGSNGTGQLGIQNMLGKVDLVIGSFSKTFASNGGFVAANSESVKH